MENEQKVKLNKYLYRGRQKILQVVQKIGDWGAKRIHVKIVQKSSRGARQTQMGRRGAKWR